MFQSIRLITGRIVAGCDCIFNMLMCFDTWLTFKARFLKIIFFKTTQGTFYFYLDNFENNIGMEIILASVESSLNCLPDGITISKLGFPTYSSLW